MNEHKFPYKWNLSYGYPAKGIEPNGLKVFGTFICGGGSTMGYKLAGFDHLGGVEIDPKLAEVYKANHSPKYFYTADIREFKNWDDLPQELYSLDLLDGSPPCSSFSMAGNRDKDWGKKKMFREGQSMQSLDDLFFHYIDLAKKLQPKVVIAENVKGLIQGNARGYTKRIKREFEAAGYKVQLFLLNAASMGVPQKRERVFFICQRNDMGFKPLKLEFNEKAITFGEYKGKDKNETKRESYRTLWSKCKQGKTFASVHEKGTYFGEYKCSDKKTPNTIIANQSGSYLWHSTEKRPLNKSEICQTGTYPIDFDFQNIEPKYLIGMSVPPVMTAQIAHQIYLQWFKKQK